MTHLFQYSVLKYTHDQVTQEFVNIGVLIFSADSNYLDVKISTKYNRLSHFFNGIDFSVYQRLRRTIEKSTSRVGSNLSQLPLLGERNENLEYIIEKVLPKNDSALSFSDVNGGITDNLDLELSNLFTRIVEGYIQDNERPSRSDDDIWNQYVKIFREKNIYDHLDEVTIPTKTFEYKFNHAFKNDRWHPIEPLSFDLMRKSSIEEKASRWIGRAITLATSEEIGTLYIISGLPKNEKLISAYEKAKRGLQESTSGIKVKVIDETEIETFSDDFKLFIEKHK